MKTLDEAITEGLYFGIPVGTVPDVNAVMASPQGQTISGIVGDIGESERARVWVGGYVRAFLIERGALTVNDLLDLVAGSFANGVFIGILMEKQ